LYIGYLFQNGCVVSKKQPKSLSSNTTALKLLFLQNNREDSYELYTQQLDSAVQVLGLDVGGQLGFPSIAIEQQLFLVVQQFFVRFGRVFKVWALKVNRIK
jgi:hypothetical protein